MLQYRKWFLLLEACLNEILDWTLFLGILGVVYIYYGSNVNNDLEIKEYGNW